MFLSTGVQGGCGASLVAWLYEEGNGSLHMTLQWTRYWASKIFCGGGGKRVQLVANRGLVSGWIKKSPQIHTKSNNQISTFVPSDTFPFSATFSLQLNYSRTLESASLFAPSGELIASCHRSEMWGCHDTTNTPDFLSSTKSRCDEKRLPIYGPPIENLGEWRYVPVIRLVLKSLLNIISSLVTCRRNRHD